MDWKAAINAYKAYLRLERSMSPNTLDAYLRDVEKLAAFSLDRNPDCNTVLISTEDIRAFVEMLYTLGLSERTQARIISGIRSFYKFLLLEDIVPEDPSELIENPKLKRKIPEVLSYSEINEILSAIDLSEPYGHRDRAMLETLYACGLRVSELTGLKISNIYFDIGFIRVIGKNNKERLIPIAPDALKYISIYLNEYRSNMRNIDPGSSDILFLNLKGRGISRISVFNMVKKYSRSARIQKNVSPHTFRHSFATHLVEGGADLRVVQEMLGHESILTTEIYTHLDRDYLRETILRFHNRGK